VRLVLVYMKMKLVVWDLVRRLSGRVASFFCITQKAIVKSGVKKMDAQRRPLLYMLET